MDTSRGLSSKIMDRLVFKGRCSKPGLNGLILSRMTQMITL